MTSDQQPGADSLSTNCPKCGTPKGPGAQECLQCGIIFAKYRSVSTSPNENPAADQSWKRYRFLLAAGVVIVVMVVLVAGLWRDTGPEPLAPNQIRITYEHGETCTWTDWTFTYIRLVSNNRARGNTLMVGPQTRLTREDRTLRVFSPDGEKLAIPAADLREMILEVRPDPDNTSSHEVQVNRVVTASGTYVFEATPLPKFSRSRVLVPVISYYFPEHSDKYMTWGNARLFLSGTVPEDCSTDRVISLTRPEHPQSRTPVHIEFPGA